jgi:putative heme-binding domain-containing protein
LRQQAVHALAQSEAGAEELLKWWAEPGLPEEVRSATRHELSKVRWPGIRSRAGAGLASGGTGAAVPRHVVSQLAAASGDAARGAAVFLRETVGCSQCHQVQGRGTDFGPDLTEIGTKLAKEAIYEAILDPNAGISFGYEAWQIELHNGEEIYGLLASETADELAIKTQNGIVTRFRKSEIARKTQQRTSIMLAGLELAMSSQELIDLVEYLSSLRRRTDSGQGR